MALTGDAISAERAYDLGLVNAVLTPDEVMETALARAERIAADGPRPTSPAWRSCSD